MVLPENVVDVDCSIAGSLPDSQTRAQARRLNTSVVVGIVEKSGNQFRNAAAVLWGPDGGRHDRYEKEHGVPFGEYIPSAACSSSSRTPRHWSPAMRSLVKERHY